MRTKEIVDNILNKNLKDAREGIQKELLSRSYEHIQEMKPDVMSRQFSESVKFNGRTFKDYKTFNSDKEANDFLEKNDDYGVIGTKGNKVYVAKLDDMGESVKHLNEEDDTWFTFMNISNVESLYTAAMNTKNAQELKKVMMGMKRSFPDGSKINWQKVDWNKVYNDMMD